MLILTIPCFILLRIFLYCAPIHVHYLKSHCQLLITEYVVNPRNASLLQYVSTPLEYYNESTVILEYINLFLMAFGKLIDTC